jgi:outer membrane protein assembly factor BamB
VLVAVGLVVAFVRNRDQPARRAPLVIALIATLIVTTAGGVIGLGLSRAKPAPVDSGLTIFTQSSDCSNAPNNCDLPNALFAVRASDGSVRWKVVESAPNYFVGSTPLFRDGIVYAYIYTGPDSMVGSNDNYLLTAWRGRDGARLWSTRVLGQCCVGPETFFTGDDLAILGISGADSAGEPMWNLQLIRASDGATVGMTSLPGVNTPVVVGDHAYQCLPDESVVAMRVSDGAPIWRSAPLKADPQTVANCALVMEADGIVFESVLLGIVNGKTGKTGELLALNAANGRTLWRYMSPTPLPLAVGDGLVIVGEGSAYTPSGIIALGASNGSLAWRRDDLPPAPTGRGDVGVRTALIGDGLVLVGGGGYTLFALRTDDGSVAWQTTGDYHRFEPIGVVGGVVFLHSLFTGTGSYFPQPYTDEQSYLSAQRASDGAQYWQTALQSGGGSSGGGYALGEV